MTKPMPRPKRAPEPTGEELRRLFQAEAHRRGLCYYHANHPQGSAAGLPDLLVVTGLPVCLWALEFKSRGEQLRPEQIVWRLALWPVERAGGGVRYRLVRPDNAAEVAEEMGWPELAGRLAADPSHSDDARRTQEADGCGVPEPQPLRAAKRRKARMLLEAEAVGLGFDRGHCEILPDSALRHVIAARKAREGDG